MVNINNEKGIALIIVLWIAVVLSGITIAGAYLTRLEMRQANYPKIEMQLLSSAVGALEKVKLELANTNIEYDSLKASWRTAFTNNITMGDAIVSVSITDEESKLNLITASRESLSKLSIFNRSMNSKEMIDSLTDWQDADSNTLPNGAENSYYKQIDPARICKNRPLDSIEELGLVKGFKDRKAIQALKKYSTVYTDGKININTASLEVLMTLPEVDYVPAQGIIAHRNGRDLIQGTIDDLPYDSINRIETVVGKSVYKSIESLITVKSSRFMVNIRASLGKYNKSYEALLYKQGRNIRAEYWKEL